MTTKQFVLSDASAPDESMFLGKVALFDDEGNPVDIGGGSGPTDVTWGDVSGKPSTFPPATHTHAVGEVTGLQAVLDDLETRLAALEAAAE